MLHRSTIYSIIFYNCAMHLEVLPHIPQRAQEWTHHYTATGFE
jgi:hypothetical protein